jgi:putative membrane protein
MRFISVIAFFAALFGPLSAAPAADKISQVFIRDAIETNLAEIQLGQLAQDKAEGSGVKSFAQTLVNDQSALNEQAEKVATQIGITIPTKPNAAQKTAYDNMSKLSGAAFDRAFVKNIIADQASNIARFENEAKKKNNPVGDYANQALSTLKQHLDAARNLKPGI